MSAETNIVGLNIEDVKQMIVVDKNVNFVAEGMFVTADYRPERTRIWYDDKTKNVTRVTKG